jgi:hypothetical protein
MQLQPIVVLISTNAVLKRINARYSFKLTLTGLTITHYISVINATGVICAQVDVYKFLIANFKRLNPEQLQIHIAMLLSCGLISHGKYRRGLPMNLKVTALGVSVLADFDRLLSTSKIKLI